MFKKLLLSSLLFISTVMAEDVKLSTYTGYSKCSLDKRDCSFKFDPNNIVVSLAADSGRKCEIGSHESVTSDNGVNFRFNIFISKCLRDGSPVYDIIMQLYSWTDINPSDVDFSGLQIIGISDISNFNSVGMAGNYIRRTENYYQGMMSVYPATF